MEPKQNILKIVGIAVSLPTAVLGSYFVSKELVQAKLIAPWVGTLFIVLVSLTILVLMIRYALKQ